MNSTKTSIISEIQAYTITYEGKLKKKKTSVSIFLDILNFVFVKFQSSKVQNFMKNQNSEPLNVVKWQVLHL